MLEVPQSKVGWVKGQLCSYHFTIKVNGIMEHISLLLLSF